MKEKFEKYLNKKFKKLADTEEVKDLKEEIINDLMEKSAEVKKTTKDEDEAYEICINSLGDLMAVIKEYKKENNKLAKKIDLPKYKLGEELVNSISHGVGAALSIAALILCIIKADTGLGLLSSLFYGISSIVLYVMSCLYHSLARNNAKRVFRIIVLCSIFLLIAGTYTPCCLCVLPLKIGWWIFGFVWGCAVLGILLNSLDMIKFKKISMVLYLIMGWCIIVTFKPLWENMNHFGIMLLLLGGVTYTVGAVLYGVGKKKQYMHSMFHLFCIAASVCFFFAVYFYAL